MKSGTRTRMSGVHAIAYWSVLCLLLALFSLGSLAAPASAAAHPMSVELISSPADDHSDCDHGPAGMTGHCCHATTSCFAYASVPPISISFEPPTADHGMAMLQSRVATRSPQPNLRPPKPSIQV